MRKRSQEPKMLVGDGKGHSYHGCLRHMWTSEDRECPACVMDAENQTQQMTPTPKSIPEMLRELQERNALGGPDISDTNIAKLIEACSVMAEALRAISAQIVNPISMIDAKQILGSVEKNADGALTNAAKVLSHE